MKFQNKIIETILKIPVGTPSSNEILCNVIQNFYELIVEASAEGFHRNVILKTPIVIVSNPLNSIPVQLTVRGQLERPAIGFQPIRPYTNGNNQQNTMFSRNFNNNPTPPHYVTPYPPPMTLNDHRKHE